MGILQSKEYSKEAEYQITMGPDNQIQVISGKQGTDYESVEHVLRLQVHDWREKSMSFRLGIDKEIPVADFKDDIVYEQGILQMSFKVPADYPGGHFELLRRVGQLVDGTDKDLLGLGISHKWIGARSFVQFNKSASRACKRKGLAWNNGDWGTEVTLYGCIASWVKKSPNSDHLHCRFRVDDNELVVFTVDSVSKEYKDMVTAGPVSTMQVTLSKEDWY
jgi:hypothetical protein